MLPSTLAIDWLLQNKIKINKDEQYQALCGEPKTEKTTGRETTTTQGITRLSIIRLYKMATFMPPNIR